MSDNTELTLTKLLAQVEQALRPVLYYATHDDMQRDHVLFIDTAAPPFIVCHPDDVEALKKELKDCRTLAHIGQALPNSRPYY